MIGRLTTLLKQEKVKNFLFFSSASFIGAIIGVITLRSFTSYMDQSEFGIWSFALTFNGFIAAFIVLDLHSYFLIEATKATYSRKELLQSLLTFSFVWSIISTLLFLLLGFLFFHRLFEQINFFPYIFYILISNLFMGFSQFLLIVYRIENKPFYYFLFSVFKSVFAILFSLLVVVYFLHDAEGRIIGYSAGMLASGLVALLILAVFYSFRFRIDRALIKKALAFSAPLIPYAISTLSMDFLDRVFIEEYSTTQELGLFGLANQINTIVYFIFISLIRVYEPSMIGWIHQQEHERLSSFSIKYNFLLVAATVSLMLLSGFIVFYLTNVKYYDSVEVVIKMSPYFYLKSISMLLLTILVSGSKTVKTMYISIFILALYAALGFPLVPIYGIDGMILIKTVVTAIGCAVIFTYMGNRKAYLKMGLVILASTVAVVLITFVIHRFNYYF